MALLLPPPSPQGRKHHNRRRTPPHRPSRIPQRYFHHYPTHIGGLLVDTGLLTLRADLMEQGLAAYRANALLPGQPAVEVIPLFPPESDVIVEWRACTLAIIDNLVPG